MNTEEKKYQKNFCDKYFGKTTWGREVLNRVDVLFKGRHGGFSRRWTDGSPKGLIHEGTSLGKYELERCCHKVRIVWDNYIIHAVKDKEGYGQFWRRCHRPPELHEYGQILEHSAELYTDKYRRDTGGEYTPSCFVTLQNKLLAKHYNMDDFIVCDTSEELGCGRNDLNVLFPERNNDIFKENAESPFDFREFMSQFSYSPEARALYDAALQVFRYYHYSGNYTDRDWNGSFYDVSNAIMDKDVNTFQTLDKQDDHRITKTKTTKGTHGFGRNNLKGVVPDDSLPMFYDFFDRRDALAVKINRELPDARLLLWKFENVF